MGKNRLEAFSDGVLAIIITIMVLEMKVPHGADFASLQPLIPVFLSYVLSFIYIGIYWNNHHHMLHTVDRVNGGMMWANMHLLFWLSLVPFVTGWMGENHFETFPVMLYGAVLFMAGFAYYILSRSIIAHQGHNSRLKQAIGKDIKGKASIAIYAASLPLAYANPWIAIALYVLVAIMWLVPDQRIENNLK